MPGVSGTARGREPIAAALDDQRPLSRGLQAGICFSEIDPGKKEIRSSWRGSACEHGRTTYRWEKGELVVAEQETETIICAVDQGSQCCSDDEAAAGQCLVQTVVEKRIGATLKVVSTRKEKTAPEP